MADKDVVIRIRAKNLIEAEFKKMKKSLAGIGATKDVVARALARISQPNRKESQ